MWLWIFEFLTTEECYWVLFYKTSLILPPLLNVFFQIANKILIKKKRRNVFNEPLPSNDREYTKLKFRLTASPSWWRAPIWNSWPNIFPVWQLWVSWCWAPFLTRGWVCNLLVLLLGLARAVTLGSKSHRTHDHILLSHLKLPQPRSPYLYPIPQKQCGAVTPPRALGSLFVASYDSQGYGGGTLTRLHTGKRIHRTTDFPLIRHG
jgi:hypothetical protein